MGKGLLRIYWLNMKDSLKMIKSMGKEQKHGTIYLVKVKNVGKENG